MDRQEARSRFRWTIPERFNIGRDVVYRHGDALALIEIDPSGKKREYSFLHISRMANRLANVLVANGLTRGERVAILLPQRHETAVAHVAVYHAGLVAVPLFTLFGEEALKFRLENSGARALVTDRDQLPKVAAIRDRLPPDRVRPARPVQRLPRRHFRSDLRAISAFDDPVRSAETAQARRNRGAPGWVAADRRPRRTAAMGVETGPSPPRISQHRRGHPIARTRRRLGARACGSR